MKPKHILIKAVALFVICLAACSQNKNGADDSPSNFEIYKYFDKKLGQTASAGGYVNYKVKIDRYQQAQPIQTTTPDGNNITAYPVKIDRTEYLNGYHETYVSTFKGDEYQLYRDSKGNLVELSHTPGQTETSKRPPSSL